jgi:hypothetical protein
MIIGVVEYGWSLLNQFAQAVIAFLWPIMQSISAVLPRFEYQIPTIATEDKIAMEEVSPVFGVILMLLVFGGIGIGLLFTILRERMHDRVSKLAVS